MDRKKYYLTTIKPELIKVLEMCKDRDIPFVFAAHIDDDRDEAHKHELYEVARGAHITEDDQSNISPVVKDIIIFLNNAEPERENN